MNIPNDKNETVRSKCELCNVNERLYSCPRCNIQYCSVNCYKSNEHSQCSEQFYEKWVQDEVSTMGGDSAAKAQMADLLRKMQREAEAPEEDVEDDDDSAATDSDDETDSELETRFSEINLDVGEEIWEALTNEERSKFVQMISSGQILNSLPVWKPWWSTISDGTPDLACNVPLLSQLKAGALSPHLSAIVMNSLGAYLVTCRFLKGEVHGFCVEAATAIWQLSKALRCGPEVSATCINFEIANKLLLEDIAQCPWIAANDFKFELELLERDVDTFREQGPDYFLLALSDMLAIFDEAASTLKTANSIDRFTGAPPKISELKRAAKKITFYLAWAKEADPQVWDCVTPIENIPDD